MTFVYIYFKNTFTKTETKKKLFWTLKGYKMVIKFNTCAKSKIKRSLFNKKSKKNVKLKIFQIKLSLKKLLKNIVCLSQILNVFVLRILNSIKKSQIYKTNHSVIPNGSAFEIDEMIVKPFLILQIWIKCTELQIVVHFLAKS